MALDECDICVIGAGPAGMAAATTAAEHGARVTVLDEQSSPGGQIYRGIQSGGTNRAAILGDDYLVGADAAATFSNANTTYRRNAVVWQITPQGDGVPRLTDGRPATVDPAEQAATARPAATGPDGDIEIIYSTAGEARVLNARRLILATGALERPFPIPGWTLPGVMTAGAGQILLKQAGVVPGETVLAGSGPLLYLLAVQLIRAGAPPVAMVETHAAGSWRQALPHMARALPAWDYIAKGGRLLADIRKARIPRYRNAQGLAARGAGAVEALSFTSNGWLHEIACTTLLLHQGVVPNVQISRALRLDHTWSSTQRCWHPTCDDWGNTSIPGIAVAGDGAGIGGAVTAQHSGHIASLAALASLEHLTTDARDRLAAPHLSARERDLAIRPFLDTLYAPAEAALRPSDETIVCRCEEVTAGDIREHAKLGCRGPNQTKAFSRAGMGPCQGRVCGLVVSEILAEANGMTMPETGYYRLRMPTKPVTLGEMAGLASRDREQD